MRLEVEGSSRPDLRGRLVGRLLVLAVALLLVTESASARSFHIEEFRVVLNVGDDGIVEVTESIRFAFEGSYQGIYREIPIEYSTAWGLDYELRLESIAVTDDHGAPLQHETDRSGDLFKFKVWIPDAQDASKTITLRYRVRRALRFFEEGSEFGAHDELYWNVTGSEWAVPIDGASARIRLPAGVREAPSVTAYTGAYGDRGQDWSWRESRRGS